MNRNLCVMAAALAATGRSLAQSVIDVPLAPLYAAAGLGAGGYHPAAGADAASPTGYALSSFQPASYAEWKVNCQTPGMYRIGLHVSETPDPAMVFTVESRPLLSPDDPYATRYDSPDTRDYGRTHGPSNYVDLGDLEDNDGVALTVPLWSGDNVIRIRNITGRHRPADTYPPDMTDTHDREWSWYWSDVHVGSIHLTRAGSLPDLALISGTVMGDNPALPVPSAVVCATSTENAPEPGPFWKQGWTTLSHDDGSYALYAPSGSINVHAGRPDSYQVQGSQTVSVTAPPQGSAQASLQLTSLFRAGTAGSQTAQVMMAYGTLTSGDVGILAVDGENGYKVGWMDPGDAMQVMVDAPRTGNYQVATTYFNGGSAGVVRLSTSAGASVQISQPVTSWQDMGTATTSSLLHLVRGVNTITETLVSGNSDINAIHLTTPAPGVSDATRALRIAAGLIAATPDDGWLGQATGGPEITTPDAVQLLRSVNGL